MLPTIATGNVASALAGEYEVANSLRFDDGSTDYLSISGSTPDNRKKFTYSFWFKRSHLGTDQVLLSYESDSNNRGQIQINSSDQLRYFERSGGSTTTDLVTNRLFRDVSAWYSIIISVDTSQGTDTNRVKIYVNGVQETSFATSTYPSQNYDTNANGTYAKNIGRRNVNTDFYLDGYLTEVVFIDGTQQANTDLGEFDSDTNIWKPKDVSGLTFGTNGFYLDFENSGSLGADVSGNGNNFTVNNLTSIDQTTDTCTNNFATFNPLFPTAGTSAFSEGNLKLVASGSAGSGLSSFGISKGKWYMEVKQTAVNEPLGNGESGICVVGDPTGNLGNVEGTAFAYGIRNHNGTKFENASSSTSWHGNWTAGDIISVALDMDNHRVYFAKNGQYADGSGNWDEAFTGSPAYLSLSTAKTDYFLAMSQLHSSATETYELNFGSPSFSISSGNSDADGYGNFEYSVPSGYYALNSKNLAEYG